MVAATSVALRDEFLREIGDLYTITTVIDPTMFLGITISRDRENNTLEISQPQYIQSLLEKHDIPLVEKNPPSTPMVCIDTDPTSPVIPSPYLPISAITTYQSRIGGLLYLAINFSISYFLESSFSSS